MRKPSHSTICNAIFAGLADVGMSGLLVIEDAGITTRRWVGPPTDEFELSVEVKIARIPSDPIDLQGSGPAPIIPKEG